MPEVLHVLLTGLGVISLAIANHKSTDDVYKVRSIDFENTNVEKLCLIAQFNATIRISHKSTNGQRVNYSVPLPLDASTDGSICDVEYTSKLILNFDGSSFLMTFFRNTKHLGPAAATYCDKCDYGTWTVTQMKTTLQLGDQYEFHASVTQAAMQQNAPELVGGIDIKRAFKCQERDRITVIPLQVNKVLNKTSSEHLHTDSWSADIVFYLIQVQPFLVFSEHFNDAYLCRDITVSVVLIVVIPILYFVILIMFYRIKGAYGCPPKCSDNGNKPLKSSSESDTCMEEESTNIMSGFSSIPLGLNTASSGYC